MDTDYINVRELSKRLGVSSRTIRAWIKDWANPPPTYRVGRKLLFQWSEIVTWLNCHKIRPGGDANIVDELMSSINKDATR